MARHLANALLAAFLLWTMMFSPWTAPRITNVWGMMAASALLLVAIAFWFSHRDGHPHPLLEYAQALSTGSRLLYIGIGTAAIAALAFFSPRALLFGGVGMAEEIFWRGYIQRTLADYHADGLRIGNLHLSDRQAAYATALLLNTGVCLTSTNSVLIGTALVSGWLFGGIYYRFPQHYPALVLAHALVGVVAGLIL